MLTWKIAQTLRRSRNGLRSRLKALHRGDKHEASETYPLIPNKHPPNLDFRPLDAMVLVYLKCRKDLSWRTISLVFPTVPISFLQNHYSLEWLEKYKNIVSNDSEAVLAGLPDLSLPDHSSPMNLAEPAEESSSKATSVTSQQSTEHGLNQNHSTRSTVRLPSFSDEAGAISEQSERPPNADRLRETDNEDAAEGFSQVEDSMMPEIARPTARRAGSRSAFANGNGITDSPRLQDSFGFQDSRGFAHMPRSL